MRIVDAADALAQGSRDVAQIVTQGATCNCRAIEVEQGVVRLELSPVIPGFARDVHVGRCSTRWRGFPLASLGLTQLFEDGVYATGGMHILDMPLTVAVPRR